MGKIERMESILEGYRKRKIERYHIQENQKSLADVEDITVK